MWTVKGKPKSNAHGRLAFGPNNTLCASVYPGNLKNTKKWRRYSQKKPKECPETCSEAGRAHGATRITSGQAH